MHRLACCLIAALCISTVLDLAVARSDDDAAPHRLPPPGAADLVYVALGDSTVEGIGATSPATNYPSRIATRLREIYPATRLENLGVAGAIARDVVTRQLERAIALRPALVTLSVGPNDVTGGVSADDYARNVERILRDLHERTAAVVVVNAMPDLALTPRFARSPVRDEVGRRAIQLNEALTSAARRWHAEIVDLHDGSRREAPGRPELFAADGYHPSDAGYARWADFMWQGIARRLPPGRHASSARSSEVGSPLACSCDDSMSATPRAFAARSSPNRVPS